MKKTPFYQWHLQNKGRMVDFAGWSLPLEYQSSLKEAKLVRSACGLFDVSHMGEIVIEGKAGFDFLQKLVSNDLSLAGKGQLQYNLFINPEGGIIDDGMIYRQDESFFCVVNAVNKDKVLAWLEKNKKDVEITDRSNETALISIQGPHSTGIAEKVFGLAVGTGLPRPYLQYMGFIEEKLGGKNVLISRSGYTGEDGYEIYIPWNDARYWWDKLIEAGRNFGLVPCGLGARDILRIEAGYPLYGHEIDDTTNPYEACLGWAVKLNKDFMGKTKILRTKQEGIKRKRVGFTMQERGLPRQNYSLYHQGKKIGSVSSGAYSPNLERFIGMAYVETDYSAEGTEIEVEIRDKFYKAKVSKFPFIRPKTARNVGRHNA